MNPVSILLVDDQALFREGLRTLLSIEQSVEIVGEASNGLEAVEAARTSQPDLVLMDLRMPLMGGVEATRRVREASPQTRVLVLTTFREDDEIFDALRAGACGYLLKDTPSQALVDAIHAAVRGESVIEPSVAAKVVAEFTRLSSLGNAGGSSTAPLLSAREYDVLRQVARGRTNKEIASALYVTEGTVKNHLTNIFSRLGVTDRTQAALKARDLGIVWHHRRSWGHHDLNMTSSPLPGGRAPGTMALMFKAFSCAASLALIGGAALGAEPATPVPTFTEHIAPIFYQKCAGCHREGQSAPFKLLTYAQVKKRAEQIADATGDRIMPPWHADPGVVTYANDRSLSDEQIALVRQWVAAGAPEGDPAKLPPAPTFPEGWQLGEPDFVAQVSEAYPVPAEGPDRYRNFVVPLNLTEDTWINAIEFRPSAPSVVHHVLYFLDTSGKAQRSDAADPAPGYDGMGRSNGNFRYLGGWDLGSQPTQLGYGLAWLIPKGADLVLQVHYHPNGKLSQEDRSMLGFHRAEKPTARPWTIVPVPPFFGILAGINIPAGEKDYVRRNSLVLPVDVEAIGVNGHAHYLAKRMEMTATLPNGEKQWLLKTSDWNFAWQEDYAFKQPIKLPAGTRLDSMISWDNSDSNPHQFAHPPKPVRWGPRSTDEMGTLTLTVMLNTPDEKKAIHTALKRTLTGEFIQRIFENDTSTLGAVRSQISGEMPMPEESKLMRFRALTMPLDRNGDGTLDNDELQPGIDFVLPMMRGFGEIGID